MKPYYLIAAAIVTLLVGCMPYGHEIETEITKIGEVNLSPEIGLVEIYFGETPPQKEYIQIALIEVVGKKYSPTDTLLAVMKRQAQNLGADAIVSVKKSYRDRETGDLVDDLLNIGNEKHKNEAYSAPILTGVAIRYKRED
jgi:hypothetical protein